MASVVGLFFYSIGRRTEQGKIDTMINDTFYDFVLQNLDSADAIYQPTSFWMETVDSIGPQLRDGGVARFRSHSGCGKFFCPTYLIESLSAFDPDITKTFVGELEANGLGRKQKALLQQLLVGHHLALADYRAYLAGDVDVGSLNLSHASESALGEPAGQCEFDGRVFSRSMLNYLNLLVFLKRNVDCSGIKHVLEIGGGFGTLGEILISDPDREYTYVDLDIPPTIYPASWYLDQVAGDQFASAIDFKEGEISFSQIESKSCVFPTWYLPRLRGSFDLFVNSISFQEMEPRVVRNYAAQIARLQCRYVLLRNLREGKPKKNSSSASPCVEEPVVSESYDQIFAAEGYRLIGENVHPFGFATADGFHSEIRLYASDA